MTSKEYISLRKSWQKLKEMDLPIPDAHKIFIINGAIALADQHWKEEYKEQL